MPREGKGSNLTLGSFLNRGSTRPFKPFWDYTHNKFILLCFTTKHSPGKQVNPFITSLEALEKCPY